MILLALSCALAGAAKDSCAECHAALDGPLGRPATLIKHDIHAAQGFSCANCHGGDPTADDPGEAMSRAKGFLGKVPRRLIPKMCAGCHSNPNVMRKYGPQQRVDQYELYLTSIHGQRLAAGDEKVATCIDCHSVHDIRKVKDGLAPVHPLRLPDTCGRCHADRQRMAKYGIPTNQLQDYHKSVHWAALTRRGDLSAPTCASCHGNHGAKPPQVASVAAVCGTCHVMHLEQYAKSPHQAVFADTATGGCTLCHSNHAIQHPTLAMLIGRNSVCAPCHESGSEGAKTAVQMAEWLNGLDAALQRSESVLNRAEYYGMEVSEPQVRLHDGRENLVKARLALHSFRPAEMHKPVNAGFAIARETLAAGEAALREKDIRRLGLAVSVVFILVTMVAIWALIRRLERNGRVPDTGAARG